MQVKAKSVVRVIIAGEWIWVEPGTFEVTEFAFTDDHGNPLNVATEAAYHFRSTNGDPYFGPLSAIQLIKLRPPELEAGGAEQPPPASSELPAGDESTPAEQAPEALGDEPKKKLTGGALFAKPMSSPDEGGLL